MGPTGRLFYPIPPHPTSQPAPPPELVPAPTMAPGGHGGGGWQKMGRPEWNGAYSPVLPWDLQHLPGPRTGGGIGLEQGRGTGTPPHSPYPTGGSRALPGAMEPGHMQPHPVGQVHSSQPPISALGFQHFSASCTVLLEAWGWPAAKHAHRTSGTHSRGPGPVPSRGGRLGPRGEPLCLLRELVSDPGPQPARMLTRSPVSPRRPWGPGRPGSPMLPFWPCGWGHMLASTGLQDQSLLDLTLPDLPYLEASDARGPWRTLWAKGPLKNRV